MHKYTEAIEDCLKSIEIDPNYSKAYSRLGLAYYAQGNYHDAIEKGFKKGKRVTYANASLWYTKEFGNRCLHNKVVFDILVGILSFQCCNWIRTMKLSKKTFGLVLVCLLLFFISYDYCFNHFVNLNPIGG